MRWSKRLRWRVGFARVVRLQVRTGRPPETRATFDRLRATGLRRGQAYRLLAAVYEAEVATMIRDERVYDHAAYVRALDALPSRPAVSLDQVSLRRPA